MYSKGKLRVKSGMIDKELPRLLTHLASYPTQGDITYVTH